jgi:hypothetical protein
VKVLDPKINIKSRYTYSRGKLDLHYKEVKTLVDGVLKAAVPGLPGIALTTDMWTSRNNDAYMSLTCHFVDHSFTLRTFLVGMKPFEGAHTGDQNSIELDSIIKALNLQPNAMTHRCVNDRGSNVVLAVKKSKEIQSEVFCMDHTIHLIVTKAVEDTPELREALDSCPKIAAHFHRSTKHNEMLDKKCTELNVPYKKIVLPCPTRWNSQFISIQSILDLKLALAAMGADINTIGDMLPDSRQFDLLVSAVPFLEKF